jgi:hypothetical protein
MAPPVPQRSQRTVNNVLVFWQFSFLPRCGCVVGEKSRLHSSAMRGSFNTSQSQRVKAASKVPHVPWLALSVVPCEHYGKVS